MSVQDVKLRAGNRFVNAKIWKEDGRVFIAFRYNEVLKDEIKAMENPKWHGYDNPPRKVWSVKASSRNLFQLNYLMGKDPYARYDKDWVSYTSSRPLYSHQLDMVRHGLTVHYGIWAAEMGCGKTLSAIEVIENSNFEDWYWVGPKSALYAVKLEFRKWDCKIHPVFMTYERLRNVIGNWNQEDKAPHGVIFDESARVKTPTALRSQAAMQLADGIREDWDMEGYVILMSGAPAPKSPADWWHQCEVACPGFLKEGNIHKFKNRLGIIVQREQPITGGVYPHLVTWLDDENKCAECGELELHPNHGLDDPSKHRFIKSKNEVAALYRRMRGLVVVYFKKDCLDLPDKIYKIIECKPSHSVLQVAETLVNTAPRVITGMERMRELSDGFQYKEEVIGKMTCDLCHGEKEIIAPVGVEDTQAPNVITNVDSETEKVICDKCGGTGEIDKTQRITQEVPCPKIKALINLLDEYSDCGRVVIYGGFTGSIDRIVKTCLEQKWSVLRADGRGWQAFPGSMETFNSTDLNIATTKGVSDDMLIAMDRTHPRRNELLEKYPRLAFVGQPGAAGVGLNLTASPVVIYYSNDFNADSRIQSEDRIHRTGMDENRGATIIDIVHLETDILILRNLKKKRKLQAISLGDFKNVLNMKLPREVDTIVYDGDTNE